jgi:hypothetical protein
LHDRCFKRRVSQRSLGIGRAVERFVMHNHQPKV